jgi:hypothetical protein
LIPEDSSVVLLFPLALLNVGLLALFRGRIGSALFSKMTPPEGMPVTRWYDVDTKLLTTALARTATADGEVEAVVEYSDYADIGNGVKMPRPVKVTLPGRR